MNKTELLAIGTILKFILGFAGILGTMTLLIFGMIKKDNGRLKRAGQIFLGTCLTLIVLTAIEFLLLK